MSLKCLTLGREQLKKQQQSLRLQMRRLIRVVRVSLWSLFNQLNRCKSDQSESEWAKKSDFGVAMWFSVPKLLLDLAPNPKRKSYIFLYHFVKTATNSNDSKAFRIIPSEPEWTSNFLVSLHWLCELVNCYGLLRLSSNFIQCPPTISQVPGIFGCKSTGIGCLQEGVVWYIFPSD